MQNAVMKNNTLDLTWVSNGKESKFMSHQNSIVWLYQLLIEISVVRYSCQSFDPVLLKMRNPVKRSLNCFMWVDFKWVIEIFGLHKWFDISGGIDLASLPFRFGTSSLGSSHMILNNQSTTICRFMSFTSCSKTVSNSSRNTWVLPLGTSRPL